MSRLRYAVLVNPSYPSVRNDRGPDEAPDMLIGAATLPLIGALISKLRPGCEYRIYDEIGTPVDFAWVDGLPREETLVLLSVRSSLAYDARNLSQCFRDLGFAVVMGGPHVSACVEEVRGYANAAVHGEAELHLGDVVAAFEAGQFRCDTLPGLTFERRGENADLSRTPMPERSLYCTHRSWMNPGVIEFGRGCQYQCSFCASTNLYTNIIRHKPIQQVVDEIRELPARLGVVRSFFFGDDNFAASHKHTRALCRAIGEQLPRVRWGCAMTIASARDESLLDDMVAGGLRYAFIGFDSVVQASLDQTRKTLCRAEHFSPLVDALRKRGVFVLAALVFGFDYDGPDSFEQTLDWALETGVDGLNLNVLRPYPSSPTYQMLRREGRLLVDPWWLQPHERRRELVHHLTNNLSSAMTTFQPKRMSPRELTEGTLWLGQQFYATRRVIPRILKNWRGVSTLIIDTLINQTYGKQYRSLVPVRQPATRAVVP